MVAARMAGACSYLEDDCPFMIPDGGFPVKRVRLRYGRIPQPGAG